MQSLLNVGSKMTAIFLVATSIGAQVVKIPVVAWIDTYPMSLMWIFLICTTAISVLFISAKSICIIAKYIYAHQNENIKKNEDNNNDMPLDDSSQKSLLDV